MAIQNADAMFTEVLQISVDSDQFAADLKAIETEWNDAVARMAEQAKTAGLDPSQLLNSSAFAQDINSIEQQVTQLSAAVGEAFGALGATITETMGRAEQAVDRVMGKVQEGSAAGAGSLSRTPYEKMQLKHEEAIQQDLKLTQEAEQQKQAAYEETMSVFDSAAAKQAQSFQQMIEEQEAALAQLTANEKAAASEWANITMIGPEGETGSGGGRGMLGNFWAGFTAGGEKSMAEMIGGVTRWLVLWQAVGAAIGLVMNGLHDIVGSFQDGIKYAADMQDQAVKMQGVLADNVTFSKDIAQNFQIAGQAAQFVVQQLQNVAIQDKLNPDQLSSAFRALVSGGGGAVTSDVQQLVQLTEMFGLAMQASGKDVMVVRSLISEIPKLMDGTISDSSKLLQVLHLNKTEWEGIREEALQHHDLVQRLAPLLQPYLDAVQQAQVRHSVLLDQFDLLLKREEAAFAGPLMQSYDSFLQRAITFLQENRVQVEAIGRVLGGVVISTGHFLSDLNEAVPILKPIVMILMTLLASLSFGLEATAAGLADLAKGLGTFKDMLNHPFDTERWKRDIDDFNNYVFARGQQLKNELNSQAGSLYEIYTGKKAPGQTGGIDSITGKQVAGSMDSDMENIASTLETFSYEGARGPRTGLGKSVSDATLLLKDFRQEFDQLKNAADADRNAIKEAMAEGQTSVISGESAIIQSYQQEQSALQSLIDKYKERVSADNTLKPQQKKAELAELQTLQDQFNKNVQDSESRSEQDIAKEVLSQRQATYTTLLRMAKQTYDSDAKLAQEAARSKEIYESQALATELAANERYHERVVSLLQSEESIYAADTKQRTQIEDQLAAENQRYSNLANQLTEQRVAALQKETMELQKQIAAHAQLAATLQANQSKFDAQHGLASPSDKVQGQYAELQAQIDAKFQAYQAALEQLRQSATMTADDQAKAADAVAKAAEQYNLAVEAWSLATDNLHNLQMKLFGFDVESQWSAAKTTLQEFTVGLRAAAGAAQSLGSMVSSIEHGFQSGGTLGGIGAIMGQAGQVASAFGPVGAMVGAGLEAGGQIFSMISGLFTSAAKDIANNIKQTFDSIVQEYQAGNATLVSTIAQLQQQRQQAIDQLSGTKGGDKYLQQTIDMFNKEILSLQKQQQQILEQFDDKLYELQTSVAHGNDVLAQSFQLWTSALKQAKDALGAGAKPQQVQQYLNLTLKQQESDLQDKINQGEEQAIQDNFKLNDLLTQRQTIMDEIQKLQVKSQDSIERREAGAITAARQTADQKAKLEEQLSAINEQITVEQHKVTLENQIFGLTNDITKLHQLDAQLQEQAIDKQLSQYITMKQLLQSLLPLTAQIFGPGNVGFAGRGFLGNSGMGGVPGVTATPPVTIHVNFNGGLPNAEGHRIGNEIGRGIYDELYYRHLSGRFIGA